MSRYTAFVAPALGLALLTPTVHAAARGPRGDAQDRVLQEAQEQRDAVRPVVAEMRRVRAQAGTFGAIALPHRFAGQAVGPDAPAARQAGEPHYLMYDFDDGATLSYYSDFDADFASISVWEGSADGSSSTSLYASAYDGSYASRSLGFFESDSSGDAYTSEGVSLWKSAWDEGGPEPVSSAVVTEFSSSYSPLLWFYEGVDHQYESFERTVYSGEGTVSEDGALASFIGTSRVEGPLGMLRECASLGDSFTDSGERYEVTSDYWDDCEQGEAPFNHYSAFNHTEYRWDYATNTSEYIYSGTIECSDVEGATHQYTVDYDAGSYSYVYVDLGTAEVVPELACAWDPWAVFGD